MATRPGAWCRRVLPRLVVHATCRSRGAVWLGQIRWNSLPPIRKRCAQIRCKLFAFRDKSRSRELSSRAHSGSQPACLRSRACQNHQARGCRRSLLTALQIASQPLRALRPRSSSPAISGCAPERHAPALLSVICRSLHIRHTCPPAQSKPRHRDCAAPRASGSTASDCAAPPFPAPGA